MPVDHGAEPATAPADASPAPELSPPPPDVAAWRRQLAELETLEENQIGATTIDDIKRFTAAHDAARAQLMSIVAALPDDDPDLVEAACHLGSNNWELPRGALETQLRRAIALATRRAADDVSRRFGALHAFYLSIEPAAGFRGTTFEMQPGAMAIAGGAGQRATRCPEADEGHLRLQLVELYDVEARYPVDPYTKAPLPGEPTSKHKQRGAAVLELDALYRELSAAKVPDAALATVLDIAALHCPDAKVKARVCAAPAKRTELALTLRERALAPDALALASSRILHARTLRQRRAAAAAEAQLRRVLADASAGSVPRLHAALDLLVQLRKDTARARDIEAVLRADLALPASDAYLSSEVARAAATIATQAGRTEDAAALLDAALEGLATAPGLQMQWQLELLGQLADLVPERAQSLETRATKVRAEVDAAREAAHRQLQRTLDR